MALAVSLDADIAAAEAQIADAEAYCNQYGCDGEIPLQSGPSINEENCAVQATAAVLDVGLAIAGRYALYAMGSKLATGALIATGEVALVSLTAVFAVGAAAIASYEFYRCVYYPQEAAHIAFVDPTARNAVS